MSAELQRELDEAVARVLASQSQKKLVVAGPGAGKTFLFRKLLDGAPGGLHTRLVLTFINNLKADLDRSLGDAALVFTLHGYCQYLLHGFDDLRAGLSSDFLCYPGLVSLIKRDWEWLKGSKSPEFVALMRALGCTDEQEQFYLDRADYYDAVDFDDSVYRTARRLQAGATAPNYDLVLIDEFQDFNKMEAAVIDALADANAIVIAGDDDQALYSQLRGASWDHIRERYQSGHYEIFELPFCMRCPEVIVGAVADVIERARAIKRLDGRIDKPYRYFEPVKGKDSLQFPKIDLVTTTVQRGNANYFGRYIEQRIRALTAEEIKAAQEKFEPAVLVIGPNPYRRQIEEHLVSAGLYTKPRDDELTEAEQACEILSRDQNSNLGWRIILSLGDEERAQGYVRTAAEQNVALAAVIPDAEREDVLNRAKAWAAAQAGKEEPADADTPMVKITSYEGSKGLSAQYVFLVGLQAGDMPKNEKDVQDIDICRFLVGLTRTKKQCSILVTARFGNDFKQPSAFIGWIKDDRYTGKTVDAAYWKTSS